MKLQNIQDWFLKNPYRQRIFGAILFVAGITVLYAINTKYEGSFAHIFGIDIFHFAAILFALMCVYIVGLRLSDRINKK